MQYFYIKKGSINPTLRIELINDGNFDFMKNATFNNAIQNAIVTFSMTDKHDILKISKAKCTIILTKSETCEEKYIIEYQWNKRDTKESGIFTGIFEITFNNDLYEEGIEYFSGNLIVPIQEELKIHIL